MKVISWNIKLFIINSATDSNLKVYDFKKMKIPLKTIVTAIKLMNSENRTSQTFNPTFHNNLACLLRMNIINCF